MRQSIILAKEQEAVQSIKNFLGSDYPEQVEAKLDFLCESLEEYARTQIKTLELLPEKSEVGKKILDERIPKRHYTGPLSPILMGTSKFLTALGEKAGFYLERSGEDRSFIRWFSEANNLMDGKRTLAEVQDILKVEFGEAIAEWEYLNRLVDDLSSVGLISFTSPGG